MKKLLKIMVLIHCFTSQIGLAQNNEAFKILKNGNVGIATSVPKAKLDVNGNVLIQADLYVKKEIILEGKLNVSNNINVSGVLNAQNNINTNGKIQENKQDLVPKGTIIMWSGDINRKPKGWLLCDGSNNTPDLRDRFIVGAGKSYKVKKTGGQKEVTLTVKQMPPHAHNVNRQTTCSGKGCSTKHNIFSVDKTGGSNYTAKAGGGMPHENRPPYYALYFLMKS